MAYYCRPHLKFFNQREILDTHILLLSTMQARDISTL